MLAEDSQKPLRDDVRRLGTLLGETLVRQEGEDLYLRVERVRACAKDARRRSNGFHDLAHELASIPLDAAVPVARAFAQFLHLANVAEEYHRIRRRRAHQRDPRARPQPYSLEDTLTRLVSTTSPGQLREAVLGLRIELVMTAHPTEMMRRTLQRKYNAIALALEGLDRPDSTPPERDALVATRRRGLPPPRGRAEAAPRPPAPPPRRARG